MKTEISKRDEKKDIAAPVEKRYLLNTVTGRVLPWTPILAVRKDMLDCDSRGTLISPDKIKGDDPWIVQETQALASRMRFAGGSRDTLKDFGRHLTDLGVEKWKALGYANGERPQLEDQGKKKVITHVSPRIQTLVDAALDEIHGMALKAYWKITGLEAPKIYSFREVGYEYQRAKAWEVIGYEG